MNLYPIKVGPHTYEVSEGNMTRTSESGFNGTIDFNLQTIHMNEAMCYDQKIHTLWHETMHAMCQQVKLEADEDMIDRMAIYIMMILRDNDWLVKETTRE